MARYSLDTNTLSHLLHKNQQVAQKYRAVYAADHEFLICPVVYFELKRGLLRKDAKKKMSDMEEIVAQFRWQEFERGVWTRAAEGWADAQKNGRSPKDADLLIAAHALHFSATLVTANVKDFEFFPGLQIENWAAAGAGT
jgi:predicted nucleic acid-binding protein